VSELPPSARGVDHDVQVRFIDAEASAHTQLPAGPRTHPQDERDRAGLAARAEA
jgi:hypothetical protein